MKMTVLMTAAACMVLCGCKQKSEPAAAQETQEGATVYMTTDISPEGLVRIYEALGVKAEGRVAVKISSGEGGNKHYLKPELIGALVKAVGGTLVECNTAYAGTRLDSKAHWETIREHGFLDIAPFDIMDEEGDIQIPVRDTTFMRYNRVGSHLQNYDWMINLAHFKGHQMGGFGGVLKNASIGVASTAGKLYIHTAGKYEDATKVDEAWAYVDSDVQQDHFLECMANAATAVHDYMKGKVLYINVMNNMSIDCDCNGAPAAPELKDMGIVASTDPVALDQACYDLVHRHKSVEGDNAQPLIDRMAQMHGVHTIEHAEKLGLGTRKYTLVSID